MLKPQLFPSSAAALLRAALQVFPAVKFAFGVVLALALVALVYSIEAGARATMVSLVVIVALAALMIVAAKLKLHGRHDIEVSANVFLQVALVLFTFATVLLFCMALFGIPATLQTIRSMTSFAFPRADSDQSVLLVDTDSGWTLDRQNLKTLCNGQRSVYEDRYPSFNIDMASSVETNAVGGQTLYRYRCTFQATPR